jgi:hypothetical protein
VGSGTSGQNLQNQARGGGLRGPAACDTLLLLLPAGARSTLRMHSQCGQPPPVQRQQRQRWVVAHDVVDVECVVLVLQE